MAGKEVAPLLALDSFSCAHCGALAHQHWFRMFAAGDQELIPQLEEDITELRWVKESGFPEIINNTYPNILDVLKEAGYPLP